MPLWHQSRRTGATLNGRARSASGCRIEEPEPFYNMDVERFGLQAPAPAKEQCMRRRAKHTYTISKFQNQTEMVVYCTTTVTFMIEYVCLSSMYVLMVQETKHA